MLSHKCICSSCFDGRFAVGVTQHWLLRPRGHCLKLDDSSQCAATADAVMYAFAPGLVWRFDTRHAETVMGHALSPDVPNGSLLPLHDDDSVSDQLK